jgi:predicted SAM-dependent methyltransferase
MINTKDSLSNIKYPRTAWRNSKAVEVDIDTFLAGLRKNIGKGLHLGAGASKLPGLINCDLYNPQADLKVDAVNLDMFADGSIDLIESHHMIEHLSFADAEKALKEWQRVLRPGGLLIITFPDITRICLRWLKYRIIYPIKPRPEKLARIVQMIVGSQEHAGMFHKSAYDIILMRQLLTAYGFKTEFSYAPYPRRTTPSLLVISRKTE